MMDIAARIKAKDMSVKDCAALSGIPYTTLIDIVKGKTKMMTVNGLTLYKLAKILGISMERLVEEEIDPLQNTSWDDFRSATQHRLKNMGDKAFVKETVAYRLPYWYWERGKKKEALYLVALTDYLCKARKVAIYPGFERLRRCRLEYTVYPGGALILNKLGIETLEDAKKRSIPEFMQYNLVEDDVRNVC